MAQTATAKRVREVVHEACPDIVETIKWSHPSFDHRGMVCGVSAFKAHCVLSFWKAALLGDASLLRRQVKSVDDLPSRRDLARLVKQAAKLNEDGVTVPEETRTRPSETRTLEVPDALTNALRRNKKAHATFEAFSRTNKKDYVEWMAEGKPRNWKYIKMDAGPHHSAAPARRSFSGGG